MSFNHYSRSDKSDAQYRKTGRSASSNQQRTSPGGFGRGRGTGGGVAPAPYSPSTNYSSNHSFKKTNNNVHGGQSRGGQPPVTSSESGGYTQSGSAHVQSQSQGPGASDALVSIGAARSADTVPTPRSTPAIPKAPTSRPATTISDTIMPSTAGNGPGDTLKAFPFQFGSISPGFMNGMQIPARTSSAPPNLDEQKRDQAHNDSLYVPPLSIPASVPKQQLPRKESAAAVNQSKSSEAHPVPKTIKDSQMSPAPMSKQMQKSSVHPITGSSVPMSFHQPQVSFHFGGPNPQIPPQGMPTNSLQMPMPMPLPIGSAPQVQQQVFVPGIQPHLMQPQGIMHQGQNLSFASQVGSQIPSQLSNMGISMTPQYPQQHGGNFGGPRKTTVKITDPKTREELRFDKKTDVYLDGGSSGLRTHPNVPTQSQPLPSFTPSHPIGYYPGSYNTSPVYFPPTSSFPSANIQIVSNSQAPRFNYHVGQASQNLSFINPIPSSKAGDSMHIYEPQNSAPSAATQLAAKSPAGAVEMITTSATSDSSDAVENDESSNFSRPSQQASLSHTERLSEKSLESTTQQPIHAQESLASESLPIEIKPSAPVSAALAESSSFIPSSASASLLVETAPVVTNIEGRRKETLTKSNSLQEHTKRAGKKGNIQQHYQMLTSSLRDVSESKVGSVEQLLSTSTTYTLDTSESKDEQINHEMSHEGPKDTNCLEISSHPCYSKSLEVDKHTVMESALMTSSISSESLTHETQRNMEIDPTTYNLEMSTSSVVETTIPKTMTGPSSRSNSIGAKEILTEPAISDQQTSSVPDHNVSEAVLKHEEKGFEDTVGDLVTAPTPGPKDKTIPELNRSKSTISRGKKKKKEILQKADAAGTTSDLYNAYKAPEENKEPVISIETSETVSTGTSLKQGLSDAFQEATIVGESSQFSKTEPDDWEDAAELSTPKLEASPEKDGNRIMEKKYSRDFLLKFSEQCTDLPEGFEIMFDIADALMSTSVNIPSPGRYTDRPAGGSRQDRRGNNIVDDDRWSKPGSFGPERELRLDIGYGGHAGFRPGQGGNYGVLRNPRAQTPIQHAGGILAGPLQSLGSQGGMQRNMPDSDRWQRASNFQQRGLIPSPQTPLQMMHKAERKYEVGKVPDEEQAKQRQLKAILNKLTPQNFEKLFEQVKAVNIDNGRTLTGVISQIFDKALMEPTFCEMYANFCFYLAAELPDLSEDNEKITFKRLLLNKCQEEFERGEREEEEANKVEEEGEVKQSAEEKEEKRVKAKRRMLGNIRLIGELYKKRMLTERIMHECIQKLLGQYDNTDEEDFEALCKLMSTIGEMIDHPKAKEHMDAYFDMMSKLSNNMNLSSRVRFMLKDAIDLRKNKWQQRRKVEGPKKIEEVHRDAAQERLAQTSRLARGPSMNSSARRGPSMDFGPRGSTMLSSPNFQSGGFRGLPTQARGLGVQDARLDDRSFDLRNLSIPLMQRPIGGDSITLGPQGGLARGMSIRGPTSGVPLAADMSSSPGDSRRVAAGLNGFSSSSEQTSHSSREDLIPRSIPRSIPDRFSGQGALDQSSVQEHSRNFDRSHPTSPPEIGQGLQTIPNAPSEKVWPVERLKDMSMAAIKEFYSARDEKEVALCVKELNSPSFHPSMISLWVTDSFDRKDVERDLLAKLLVNLTKSTEGVLSQPQLIKGFEVVLTTLEDAVNDAPRAPEYIGCLFSIVILENIISLKEIGQLIREGGEERGSLLEVGLAGDVLGNILERISLEKGETVLNEIRGSSNLRLETFRPPKPNRSRKLDKFI